MGLGVFWILERGFWYFFYEAREGSGADTLGEMRVDSSGGFFPG